MPRNESPPLIATSKRTAIRRQLLGWYRKNKRALPWRDAPTPYGVWVSEVMLQQTRVEVVRDYYARWMDAFPTLGALAEADEDEVLRLWQGLGYYSRARRLRAGAQFVERELHGELPSKPEELQAIPGIGPYSAGAISSIAFGEPSPIVDGNVIRVLTRVLALGGDPNKAPLKRDLWNYAAQLVPPSTASDFNQALMELGALVCTPKSPSCHACPLRKNCAALERGEVSRFPELPKRKKPTPLSMVVVLARHRGRYAVLRLPADARWWAGLDALPFGEIRPGESALQAARRLTRRWGKLKAGALEEWKPLVHTVTRFKITLTPVLVEIDERGKAQEAVRWLPLNSLDELALPAPHKKLLSRLGR